MVIAAGVRKYTIISALLLWLCAGLASAQVSFEDKTITFIIGSDAGGGTDRGSRLFGEYLSRYLPGKPRVVYRNMGAGGGKIRAANYMALQAGRDGLTVLGTDTTVASAPVARSEMSKYDPREFHPIGGFNAGGSVLIVRKDAIERLTDPSATPVVVGTVSGMQSWNAMPLWAREYLGWNLRWLPGYKVTSSLITAIRQGEIDMFGTSNSIIIDPLLEEGIIEMLVQEGIGPPGNARRRDAYPDVPTMYELLAKTKLPPLSEEAYIGWIGASQVDIWVTLPPGVAKEYVDVWRAAFDRVIQDPEFLQLVNDQMTNDAVYLSGNEVEKILQDVNGISDESLILGRDLRRKYDLSDQ
jgi:tripartite-type tricarboxylate transporter receptor subunit TctC